MTHIEPRDTAPYIPDPTLPPAWIFDLDGTLALGHFGEPGRRGPFDWSRVGEDDPNPPVVSVARAIAHDNNTMVIVVSGRSDACWDETSEWLNRHHVPCSCLLMRKDGDYRPDQVVKAELFDLCVRHAYQVIGVVDDRDSVVSFWRSIGLTCLQAAPGNF